MLRDSINIILTFKVEGASLVLHGEELKSKHRETKVTQHFRTDGMNRKLPHLSSSCSQLPTPIARGISTSFITGVETDDILN